MRRREFFLFLSIIFGLVLVSNIYADDLSVEDKISVEFKMVCAGASQSDCRKAAVQDNHEALYVNNNPFLSTKDIVSAKMIVQETLKKPEGKIASSPESMVMIDLRFDKDGIQKFNEITSKNAGRRIAIFIDGSLLATPKISDPVTTGKITIASSLTKEEAQVLVSRINKTVKLNAATALSSSK